jgi:hypothetical protein
VCTCRHSNAQVSIISKWGGLEREIRSYLGDCKSPLYIEVSVCRVVVRHTCARRLRICRKCNRRGEIRESHDGDRYSSFELVIVDPGTPSMYWKHFSPFSYPCNSEVSEFLTNFQCILVVQPFTSGISLSSTHNVTTQNLYKSFLIYFNIHLLFISRCY